MTRHGNIRKKVEGYIVYKLLCAGLALLLAIALILPSCTRKPVHVPPGHTAQDQCHICTGGFAHAYHDDPDCRGLRQCNRSVVTVTIQEAADDGYRPCAYCYTIH